jgi:hypothetical protein
MLIEYFLKVLINVCYQSPTRGGIKSVSRLLVDFGVLNDNLIK